MADCHQPQYTGQQSGSKNMSFISWLTLRLSRTSAIWLSLLSLATALLFAQPSVAKLSSDEVPVPMVSSDLVSLAIVKAKPKFFICPKGMNRDAVAISENYQINLCSKTTAEVSRNAVSNARKRQQQNLPVSTNDDVIATAEISVVAMRNIKTQKQFNLPVSTKDDIIYTARGKAYSYRFDFANRTLTIQSANGKKNVEKILSSD
jgi:hypothetical protein